jgi:hypothetical protein
MILLVILYLIISPWWWLYPHHISNSSHKLYIYIVGWCWLYYIPIGMVNHSICYPQIPHGTRPRRVVFTLNKPPADWAGPSRYGIAYGILSQWCNHISTNMTIKRKDTKKTIENGCGTWIAWVDWFPFFLLLFDVPKQWPMTFGDRSPFLVVIGSQQNAKNVDV